VRCLVPLWNVCPSVAVLPAGIEDIDSFDRVQVVVFQADKARGEAERKVQDQVVSEPLAEKVAAFTVHWLFCRVYRNRRESPSPPTGKG
jgi:hypothetical protein